jgi:ribosome-associated protein
LKSQRPKGERRKKSGNPRAARGGRAPIPAPDRGRTPPRRPMLKAHRSMHAAPTPSDGARRIALLAAQAGLDKKAAGVEIIDVTGKVDYADYLVLMTGHSDRHVTALAEAVDGLLGENGFASISVEGLPAAHWVLIDFVDVVVHVFESGARALYDLDGLWMDARRVPVPDQNA